MRYCKGMFHSLNVLLSLLKNMELWQEVTIQEKRPRKIFCVLGYGSLEYTRTLRHATRHVMLAKERGSLHERMNCR